MIWFLMIDFKKADKDKIEKIAWYLNAPVKLFVVIGIVILCVMLD